LDLLRRGTVEVVDLDVMIPPRQGEDTVGMGKKDITAGSHTIAQLFPHFQAESGITVRSSPAGRPHDEPLGDAHI